MALYSSLFVYAVVRRAFFRESVMISLHPARGPGASAILYQLMVALERNMPQKADTCVSSQCILYSVILSAAKDLLRDCSGLRTQASPRAEGRNLHGRRGVEPLWDARFFAYE